MSEAAGYTPGCPSDKKVNRCVNVHGCGVGWYTSHPVGLEDADKLTAYSRPAVYTTTSAPNHDRNLRRISRALESSLIFGHVRAAGPGASVHEYNAHPFVKGRWLFMHNGEVALFPRIRRRLLNCISDDLFNYMSGTTDSELLFMLFLQQLPDDTTAQEPDVIRAAVRAMIKQVVDLTEGVSSSLNIALTDGETIIATRYRSFMGREGNVKQPPSLYYCLHRPMRGDKAWSFARAGGMVSGVEDGMMQLDGEEVDRYSAGQEAAGSSRSGTRKEDDPVLSALTSGLREAARSEAVRSSTSGVPVPAERIAGSASAHAREAATFGAGRAQSYSGDHPSLLSDYAERECVEALGTGVLRARQCTNQTSDQLIFSSEPLNLEGVASSGSSPEWYLLPANTLVVITPHKPGVGRCTRRDFVTGASDGVQQSDTPVLRMQFEDLQDVHLGCCAAAQSAAPKPQTTDDIDTHRSQANEGVPFSPHKCVPPASPAPATAALAERMAVAAGHGGTRAVDISSSAPR